MSLGQSSYMLPVAIPAKYQSQIKTTQSNQCTKYIIKVGTRSSVNQNIIYSIDDVKTVIGNHVDETGLIIKIRQFEYIYSMDTEPGFEVEVNFYTVTNGSTIDVQQSSIELAIKLMHKLEQQYVTIDCMQTNQDGFLIYNIIRLDQN